MYFQKAGLWYRETAGVNSDIDILGGNNLHIGPYDGGNAYINQFRCLIPNFSSTTLISETIVTGNTNLFSNYNNGNINGLPLSDSNSSECGCPTGYYLNPQGDGCIKEEELAPTYLGSGATITAGNINSNYGN
jgi:hypothetical protein